MRISGVREMAWSACGISLSPTKRALVASRLEKLVRRHRFDSFGGYVAFLSERRHGDEFSDFIDTLTTNHTGFWRRRGISPFCRKRSSRITALASHLVGRLRDGRRTLQHI